MTSVKYSIAHPDDPNVKEILDKASHGEVVSQLNPLRNDWRQLGQEFCIPDHDMDVIDTNNRGRAWHCLSDTVAQWMKWNFTDNVKDKVKSNVDWLIRAVKKINPAHADNLEKVYKVKISGLKGHSAQDTNDKNSDETSDKDTDSAVPAKKAEQTDETDNPDPPNCSKMCQPIDDEDFEEMPFTEDIVKDIDIILVTATITEYRAVVRTAKPTGSNGKKYVKVTTEDGPKFMLGSYGMNTVAIIRTDRGPKETREMLMKVQPIVKAKYVIAIGICYGMNNAKSKLGDIIVAESVWDISQSHVINGKKKFNPKVYPTGAKLQQKFADHDTFTVLPDVTSVNIHYGILVTEDTFVASQNHKKDILEQIPKAIGGEKEAEGINAAATHGKYEWIVIKAITDWGDGNIEPYREWQEYASIAAARFVLKCLEDKLK